MAKTKPYYENQADWGSEEYYGLHRYLHRLILHRDRHQDEIISMDVGQMADTTKVLLYCIIKYYHLDELFHLDNLRPLADCKPLSAPLTIGDHRINEDNIYRQMNVEL